MKTILVPIDFSANAGHAAVYAYQLAKRLNHNLILCNAVNIPTELPQAGMVVWPADDYDALIDGSADELMLVQKTLEKKDNSEGFRPEISCATEAGYVNNVINAFAVADTVDLVLMGAHGDNGLNQFFLGNHAREMIDATIKPLLLVPNNTPLVPIKKIAFATDFNNIEADLKTIYLLIPIARALNAEILLTHVCIGTQTLSECEKIIKRFITDLSNKADYPNIYYRILTNSNAEAGLDWLCEHGQVEVLAMVHRKHSFLSGLLHGSHTKRMSGRLRIPLLVYPES
jgi:nucleotide-binding universal stress UspA family protein